MNPKFLLLVVPPAVIFGAAGWLIVFLETYRRYPKMEQRQRIILSVMSATVLAVILLVLTFLTIYFLFSEMNWT